ncbi:MAG TPA: rhomboid-like protein [Friedmanniella sp.]
MRPPGRHLPGSLVGLAYASAFGIVGSWLTARPVPVRDAWIADLSTNLANLADHPVRALVGSAFVTDDGTVVSWVVLAVVGLAAAGEALGNLRLSALLASGHVLGTLVSESVLAAQVRSGAASPDARFITDVGPSYVIAPALVLGLLRCPSLVGRLASGLGFALLAPHLFGGLGQLEVSSVGHVVAIGLALLVGPALAADLRARRAPAATVVSGGRRFF